MSFSQKGCNTLMKKIIVTTLALLILLVLPFSLVNANVETTNNEHNVAIIDTHTETFFDGIFAPKEQTFIANPDTSYFATSVEDYYAYIGQEMPAVLSNFIYTTLPSFAEKANNTIDSIKAKTFIDANDYKTYFTALSNYFFSVYNEFATLCNNPDNNIPADVILGFANPIFTFSSTAYNQLNFYPIVENDEHRINEIYDDLYAELKELYGDGHETQKKTYDILKTAVLDWIKVLDIDYITAYQAQVDQYLSLVDNAGWEFDPETDSIVYESTSKSRKLILGDLSKIHEFFLHDSFHTITLNADKTAFLSPDEIYASELFQALVRPVTDNFTVFEESNTFTKEAVVEAIIYVTHYQYNALHAPGGYGQPITHVFPNLIIKIFNNFIFSEKPTKLPTLENWIDPETGETPYDTYRSLNYIKAPEIAFSNTLEKTVTRTIHYVFSDGTTAAPDVIQEATFTGKESLITGVTTWNEDNLILPALDNPTVSAPNESCTVGEPAEIVEEVTVDLTTNNLDVTVTYPLIPVTEPSTDPETTEPSTDPETTEPSSSNESTTSSTTDALVSEETAPDTGDANIYMIATVFIGSLIVIISSTIYIKRKKHSATK